MALDLQKINELISHNREQDAIKLLSGIIEQTPDCDDAWFMRGKLFWRIGEKRKAMNDYARAVELNADSPAARALENAQDIQAFFNPDIFNP